VLGRLILHPMYAIRIFPFEPLCTRSNIGARFNVMPYHESATLRNPVQYDFMPQCTTKLGNTPVPHSVCRFYRNLGGLRQTCLQNCTASWRLMLPYSSGEFFDVDLSCCFLVVRRYISTCVIDTALHSYKGHCLFTRIRMPDCGSFRPCLQSLPVYQVACSAMDSAQGQVIAYPRIQPTMVRMPTTAAAPYAQVAPHPAAVPQQYPMVATAVQAADGPYMHRGASFAPVHAQALPTPQNETILVPVGSPAPTGIDDPIQVSGDLISKVEKLVVRVRHMAVVLIILGIIGIFPTTMIVSCSLAIAAGSVIISGLRTPEDVLHLGRRGRVGAALHRPAPIHAYNLCISLIVFAGLSLLYYTSSAGGSQHVGNSYATRCKRNDAGECIAPFDPDFDPASNGAQPVPGPSPVFVIMGIICSVLFIGLSAFFIFYFNQLVALAGTGLRHGSCCGGEGGLVLAPQATTVVVAHPQPQSQQAPVFTMQYLPASAPN
jgi:hypothetical protein